MKSAADYEREMLELYNKSVNKSTPSFGVLCPSTHGKACRLDDLCKEILWDKSIPKDAPIRQKASDLNRKERYYSNVIFMSNPTEVVVLEYGVKLFNQLIALQMDALSEFKYFFDAKKGRNLFIKKTQGAQKRDVDYKVTPRVAISALPDPSVLKKLNDLSNIHALVKAGKVKPVYQSKLEKDTEIRILPSWLGLEYTKFFEKLFYHYNISEDDFNLCQSGKTNPIKNPYALGEVKTGVELPSQTPMEQADVIEGYAEELSDAAIDKMVEAVEEADQMTEGTEECPICFGMYDTNNIKCLQCSYEAACDEEHKNKIRKREAARKLTPNKK